MYDESTGICKFTIFVCILKCRLDFRSRKDVLGSQCVVRFFCDQNLIQFCSLLHIFSSDLRGHSEDTSIRSSLCGSGAMRCGHTRKAIAPTQ